MPVKLWTSYHEENRVKFSHTVLIFGNKILTSWVRTSQETCHEVHYDTSLIRLEKK